MLREMNSFAQIYTAETGVKPNRSDSKSQAHARLAPFNESIVPSDGYNENYP